MLLATNYVFSCISYIAIMLMSWPTSSSAFAVKALFIFNLFLNFIRKKASYNKDKHIIKSSSKWEHDFCSPQRVSVQNKFETIQWEIFLQILSFYRLMSQFLNYWINWNLVYLFALNINKINAICISNIYICIYVHPLALITVLWSNRI